MLKVQRRDNVGFLEGFVAGLPVFPGFRDMEFALGLRGFEVLVDFALELELLVLNKVMAGIKVVERRGVFKHRIVMKYALVVTSECQVCRIIGIALATLRRLHFIYSVF